MSGLVTLHTWTSLMTSDTKMCTFSHCALPQHIKKHFYAGKWWRDWLLTTLNKNIQHSPRWFVNPSKHTWDCYVCIWFKTTLCHLMWLFWCLQILLFCDSLVTHSNKLKPTNNKKFKHSITTNHYRRINECTYDSRAFTHFILLSQSDLGSW